MSNPQLLPYEDIQKYFDTTPYDIFTISENSHVLLYEGDTVLGGSLNQAWTQNLLATQFPEASVTELLIVVNGNLTVTGDIDIGESHTLLLVIGTVTCDVLVSSDDTIVITGDANIKYAFYGYYNHGTIQIEGITHVPYVINDNHSSEITAPEPIFINAFGDDHDFFSYDYLRGGLDDVVVPDALQDGEFNARQFIEVVRAGKTPFLPDAKPIRVVNAEALAKLTAGNIEAVQELVWSERNERTFPEAILQLKHLRKLDLSQNPLGEIPEAIDVLEHLEELILDGCGLTHIPESIGNLKKLRILSLNYNHDLAPLPESIGGLQALEVLSLNRVPAVFPASFDRLDRLKELHLNQCYTDRDPYAPFPEVITRLKNLKRLDFRNNYITALPESFTNLQTLEDFQWGGGDVTATLTVDLANLKNLKKLLISGAFDDWKESVFTITSLEHLSLDRNKGLQPDVLRNLHALPNLKSLDVSFCKLTALPEEFFQLKNLTHIDLQGNKFPKDVTERIKNTFKKVAVL